MTEIFNRRDARNICAWRPGGFRFWFLTRYNAAMETLTIGQLARAANVPTSTLRFYERRGLVRPDARTAANYRSYLPRMVERLKFIRAAQSSGFSLKDIREMLAMTHSDAPPCDEIAALIQRRLEDVQKRLRQLRRVQKMLAISLKSCCRGGADWCGEIVRLKSQNSSLCIREKQNSQKRLTLH
jgi:MerR family mercuric resistance operon transcriptional regulator